MNESAAQPALVGPESPPVSAEPASPPLSPWRLPPRIPDHELLHPIGRGAYGEVWLARNIVGTLRAVKFVYRRDSGESEPFDREFKGLQKYEPVSRSHEGLIGILQIGRHEAEGCFYYIMELADRAGSGDSGTSKSGGLYEPRTLRQELKSRGRLPVGECLEIGLALTGALGHLHGHGLVHRDIKPSNIVFVNGRAKLADIGLVAEAGDARSIVGTEGYLAPEGPGTVQADLYSLGKVLYEMSTGQDRRMFPDLPREMKDWPEAQGLLELNEVILKACARETNRRYASASAMRADLERLRAGQSMRWRSAAETARRGLLRYGPLLVLGLLVLLLLPQSMKPRVAPPPGVAAERASVFVLPFRLEGTHGVPDDLVSRITDGFIDSLALIDGVRRSPRKSGWIYQDEEELRRALAQTNDMRHIVTGRVDGDGEGLRLSLRLYERGQEQPVWTGNVTAATNAVMELERRGLSALASAIGLQVTEAEQRRIDQLLTHNLEALAWCRKGWGAQQSFSVPRLTAAKEAFHRATELDPNYTDAHYGVLWIYRVSTVDRSHRDIWPDLTSRARSILQLDDTHVTARYFLGWARIFHYYDWTGGSPELTAALKVSRDPVGWAHYYRVLGRWDEARRIQAEWDSLGEESGPGYWHSTVAKYFDHRYADVVEGGRKIQRNDPEQNVGYWIEALGHIGLRDFPAAIDAIQRGRALYERQDLHALLGYVYARMGETQNAEAVLRELGHLPYTQPYWVARIHAALGNEDQALTWLEKAFDDRSELLVHVDIGVGGLRLDEAWDGLRSEPRFQELLRKTGLDMWPK